MKDTTRTRRPAIAVCGSGTEEPTLLPLARELGERIASAGCTLICGGMFGVMAAACAGAQLARKEGAEGLVVGVLPGADPDGGNPHCDVVIPTGMGYSRNALVVLAADVVIAVGGGAGTLSEVAYAWQFGKPVVALVSGGGWAARLAGSALDDRRDAVILQARTPEEAVAVALSAMPRR